MAVQRLLWIDRESGQVTRRTDAEIPALLADPSGWLWLDVPEPDNDTAALLAGAFGAHPAAVLRDNKDAYDRLSRITSSQLDFLGGITEYYRARTDTKMTIAAERLAVIAAITLPVTAISSVVGINFVASGVDRFVPLAVVVVVMLALSLVLLRWTRKQGWW